MILLDGADAADKLDTSVGGGSLVAYSCPAPDKETLNEDAIAAIPYGPDAAVLVVADGAASGIIETTPGTSLHPFGNRALTPPALMPRLQRGLELPLEFTPLLVSPGSARLDGFFAAILLGTFSLPTGMALQILEHGVHLNRVLIAIHRIELNGFAQHLRKFRPDSRL